MYNSYGSTAQNEVIFTGDTQDIIAGMYDTPNRELNPSQGRWISPDPAQQSWNAYAYATDPNRFIDPSGLDCVTLTGDSAWDASGDGTKASGYTVQVGDCSGEDPNNEFYFDGTVKPSSVEVLGEPLDEANVTLCGSFRVMTTLEFLQHDSA